MTALRTALVAQGLIGAGIAGFALHSMAGGLAGLLSPFTLWVWSPLGVVLLTAWRTRRRPFAWGMVVTAAIVDGLAWVTYVPVALHPSDAQDALVFVAGPVCQWAALGLGAAIAWLVARFAPAAA